MGHAAWFRHHRYATPEISRAEDQDLLLRSYASSRFGCLDEVLLGYHQGKFDLGKTLTARRHLLAAQERYFFAHGQWKSALLAAAATAVKVVIDAMASLPGCENLFFARMSGKVPDQAIRDLNLARGEAVSEKISSRGRGKLIYVLTEDWFFCSHFIERAAAARAEGWDVAVMTRFSRHADEIRARGLRVIPLHIDRGSIDPWRELGVIRQIYTAYCEEKPDLVHHVALKPVLYGSIAARLAGVKAVVNARWAWAIFSSRNLSRRACCVRSWRWVCVFSSIRAAARSYSKTATIVKA